jgi:hypothetical protein
MNTSLENIEIDIKTISLKPDDILIFTLQEHRLPKEKAEEYAKTIMDGISTRLKRNGYQNEIFVLAHGNEFSKITKEQGEQL